VIPMSWTGEGATRREVIMQDHRWTCQRLELQVQLKEMIKQAGTRQGRAGQRQGRALQARLEVGHQYVRSSITQRYRAEQAEVNGQGAEWAGQGQGSRRTGQDRAVVGRTRAGQ